MNVTAACDGPIYTDWRQWFSRHFNCSGRVVVGLLPWKRFGHWELCACDCHAKEGDEG